jgi:hypothetical protein
LQRGIHPNKKPTAQRNPGGKNTSKIWQHERQNKSQITRQSSPIGLFPTSTTYIERHDIDKAAIAQ